MSSHWYGKKDQLVVAMEMSFSFVINLEFSSYRYFAYSFELI